MKEYNTIEQEITSEITERKPAQYRIPASGDRLTRRTTAIQMRTISTGELIRRYSATEKGR